MAAFKYAERLLRGMAIPAHPLALTAERKFDERRQRALTRYYLSAGAGGLAVGVHTTQFAIRDPKIGLYQPVLALAMEEMRNRGEGVLKVAGVVGPTAQAVAEAETARALGYDCALLSLAGRDGDIIAHCRQVAQVLPLFGFYLQPAVGGRLLPYSFWRQFAEIENVVAIKIAPFNRYQTIDVIRAVADSGRDDIAIYTGNDDNIIADLVTPYRFGARTLHITGGLLGQFAVWTKRAAELVAEARRTGATPALMQRNIELTDANAALFDAANAFHGCIAGIHEILRRQGLLAGRWCLDPHEDLSPGQMEEIDRVCLAYPGLQDDAFVREHLDSWLH